MMMMSALRFHLFQLIDDFVDDDRDYDDNECTYKGFICSSWWSSIILIIDHHYWIQWWGPDYDDDECTQVSFVPADGVIDSNIDSDDRDGNDDNGDAPNHDD